jgi:hypothetical protein
MKQFLIILILLSATTAQAQKGKRKATTTTTTTLVTDTNPCAYTSEYTYANVGETWNLTVDTSICGFIIMKWDAQPMTPQDGCTPAGRYMVSVTNISGATTGYPCGGGVSYTNNYYYQLGSGCSMWAGGEYKVMLSYVENDRENKVLRWHFSESVQFKAGTRAKYLNTCP